MIIDCIMYAYEPDALELRLAELENVVDLTVIVEGDLTFRGEKRKPLRPDAPKTVSHVVELPPGDHIDPWLREKIQRDATVLLARQYATENTCAIVADADEIPHPADVFESNIGRTLRVDDREWFVDWRAPDECQSRNQPIIAPINSINSAYDLREARSFARSVHRGWHVSTLGDAAFADIKLSQFSHFEYDTPEWRNADRLARARNSRVDILGRFPLEHTEDLPGCISRFPHLLAGPGRPPRVK